MLPRSLYQDLGEHYLYTLRSARAEAEFAELQVGAFLILPQESWNARDARPISVLTLFTLSTGR